MIHQLFINALIGVFCYWFAECTLIPQRILLKLTGKISLKPFTCGLCLSWWSALAINIMLFCNFTQVESIIVTVLMSGFASMFSVLTMEFHKNLQR